MKWLEQDSDNDRGDVLFIAAGFALIGILLDGWAAVAVAVVVITEYLQYRKSSIRGENQ